MQAFFSKKLKNPFFRLLNTQIADFLDVFTKCCKIKYLLSLFLLYISGY
ncbi:hypothetical protein HPSNAG_1126 [Glaesserella parasuis str. Nagasaki]|nr:hypothetical protein HPSNAG_1126 [Glaesserella parasuis str. Nagasaki]